MTVKIQRVWELDGGKYLIRLSNESKISVACSNGALDLSGEAFSDVTGVGNDTFISCNGLKSVEFGPAMTKIGARAFYGCTSLASITAPNLTEIGASAFQRCTSLASITAPNLTEIGHMAFKGCASLASIIAPKLIEIDEGAFQRCTSLASITAPKLTGIGFEAFQGCTSLVSVTAPNLTKINFYAFYGCTSLASVTAHKLTEIGVGAFDGCTVITYVVAPDAQYKVILAQSGIDSAHVEHHTPEQWYHQIRMQREWGRVLLSMRSNRKGSSCPQELTELYSFFNKFPGLIRFIGTNILLKANFNKVDGLSDRAACGTSMFSPGREGATQYDASISRMSSLP